MLLAPQPAVQKSPKIAGRAEFGFNLNLWQHVVLFLLAYALLITRKPDAIFHAQFWAEDGTRWFADAYNLGPWRPLFRTEVGYFQTLPRIAADLSLLAPLLLAPLVLNILAIAIHVLPVNLMLAHRSSGWGGLRLRAALATAYIALPSSPEICANITNEQWVLAFCVFLLLAGTPAVTRASRAVEVFLVVLSGLTGPFCIFLLPISLLLALRRAGQWRWMPSGILAACCVIQVIGLTLVSPTARTGWGPRGATFDLFVRILGGNVFLGSLIGANNFAAIPGRQAFVVLFFAAILGLIIVASVLRSAPFPMKLLGMYSTMLLCAALALPSSYAPPGTSQWQMIAKAGAVRYWFLPTLTFIWLLLYGVTVQVKILKIFCGAILCCVCFGIAIQWRRPVFPNLDYAAEVRRFEVAPAGSTVSISINPEGWHMQLIKHASPGQR
ncbi:MAG: hypothetical protein JST28_14975 [Acidobacteria bacterium]|nr:hypothetical protein [Acidobacteriota bacterium]